MQLTGNTLGKRQQELNTKVCEAASNNVDFDEIKEQNETNDLDKLFKIDLASKYKNIDYIIEVLKSGDSLYISRALKCTWLYDKEYTDFINPDYLHQNVFPFMSMKMKKKMLTSISMHVRDEDRAASFYTYCLSELSHVADKFLIFTSESFKLNLINNDMESLNALQESEEFLKLFMGSSYKLVEAYLSQAVRAKIDILHKLRHMYSISNVLYLELLEKYGNTISKTTYFKRLGLRISKDIMKNHKQRVTNHLNLYIKVLNENMFVKYTTVDEAKQYLACLLPDKSATFWEIDFCKTYEFIINLIPSEERFEYIKKIFNEKYPGMPFETTIQFYTSSYYKYMTVNEKEAWALRHIDSKKELLGVGEDFNWYRFVNFDRAFTEIKNFILIATDYAKRARILAILAESARSQRDLEKLLNYYYERHVNENLYDKRVFLDTIVQDHNVYDFDENCWEVFNKLLYSMDVYNMQFYDYSIHTEYRILALIYHVIHSKEFPEGLKQYMDENVDFWNFKNKFCKLNKDRQDIMYNYLLKFFVNKIGKYENHTYNDELQGKIRNDICFVQELLEYFEKKDQCPEIVTKYMKLDQIYFGKKVEKKVLGESDLLRHLKQNASLVVNDLSSLEKDIIKNGRTFQLNQLLRKLKIYFPNDIALEYLEFFRKLLSNPQLSRIMVFTAVHGIFHLADEDSKREFLTKYVPSNPKIDHRNIDRNLLYIQEAICRFACFSRPPVPLSNIRTYINGDYLHYCLPMFHSYLSNLPLPLCIEFVESLLNAPVSVQKHGLRLAFGCFSSANLKKLVLKAWKKTKNVSLRMVVYTYLHQHMIDSDGDAQIELFEVLKLLTLDLNNDDHEDVLSLTTNCYKIPEIFRGQYLEVAWETIARFPDNHVNISRMVKILDNIAGNYKLLDKDVLKKIINDHVQKMLTEKQILEKDKTHLSSLQTAKWNLAATYFTKLNIDEENLKWILETLTYIMKKFIEIWRDEPKYVFEFIQTLINKNFEDEQEKCAKNSPIFERILTDIQDSLLAHENYMIVWNLRLTIAANKAVSSDSLQATATSYGKAVGNYVRNAVDSNAFYSSFYSYLVSAVNNGLSNIILVTNNQSHKATLHAFVGMELVEFGMLETQLLATEMLSSFYFCSSNKNCIELLRKLKKIENDQVKSLIYQKFVDSDFDRDMADVLFE